MTTHESIKIVVKSKGGPGSGNWGHRGRPGLVGGSAPSGASNALEPAWKRAAGTAPDAARYEDSRPEKWDNSLHAFVNLDTGEMYRENDAGDLKRLVAGGLASNTGIDYDEANAFVRQWAESSNDNDYRSLSIQQDAANEFDVPLSKFQEDKLLQIQRTKKLVADAEAIDAKLQPLEKEMQALENSVPEPGDIPGMPARDVHLYNSGTETLREVMDRHPELQSPEYKRYEYLRGKADLMRRQVDDIENRITEDSGDKYIYMGDYGSAPKLKKSTSRLLDSDRQSAALRNMYNRTQDYFQRAGIKEVIMYRGIKVDNVRAPLRGDIVSVKGNALESWTANPAVAFNFGNVVLAMRVPVSRILSTPMSGFGCLREYEYVIIGNNADSALVVE